MQCGIGVGVCNLAWALMNGHPNIGGIEQALGDGGSWALR